MPKVSADTINEVNDLTDIVSLIENYTHLEKRGDTWWGCCPFHNEKTPSFQVNPHKKLFYCFGCHKGGGTLKFLMEIEKISFVEAVKKLAEKSNIEIKYEGGVYVPTDEQKHKSEILDLYDRVANSFHHILLNTKMGIHARNYLNSRNVSLEIIKEFKIGFALSNRKWLYDFLQKKGYSDEFLAKTGLFSKKYPNIAFFSNRIMFPISNRHGQVIAFGGRIISNETTSPKYLNSSDMPQYQKRNNLFGLNIAIPEIRKTKSVIFCEGYMDVLAFHQAGIKNAVAPLGTALTSEQLNIVNSFASTIYFAFDADIAGQNASYKAIKLCASLGITSKIIAIQNGKDPADVLLKDGVEGLIFLVKNAIIDSDYLIQMALDRFDISAPIGKTDACKFLFPFLESLDSDIKLESMVTKISGVFGISQNSLYADYQKRNTHVFRGNSNIKDVKGFTLNAELRAMLAVVANPSLFESIRIELNADDFNDANARELFIILEECYRDDSITYDNILDRCNYDNLSTLINESVVHGEFANNVEQIVNDGVNYVKRNVLHNTRENLLGRLRLLDGKHSIEDRTLADELMATIRNIDSQLEILKG